MTWMGPTYAAWSDTVAEMDDIIKYANQTNQSLDQWKAHAKRLETALHNVAEKHRRATDAYVTRVGAEAGQAALKEAALEELKRLDPSNKLLDPQHRKVIYDKERDAAIADINRS